MNAIEIARMAAEFKRSHKPAAAKTTSGDRAKIIAGSRKVGDTINGKTISSFGSSWTETVRDCDTAAYGLAPGRDHRVTMQYAYFS